MVYWTILASLEHMGLAYILAAVHLSTAGYPFAQFVKNTTPTFWYINVRLDWFNRHFCIEEPFQSDLDIFG